MAKSFIFINGGIIQDDSGNAISSLPIAGTTGQVLVKNSATNYDVVWSTLVIGDMFKATYDTNSNGIVDNSEALGGVAAANYAQFGIVNTFVAGQSFTASLKIIAGGSLTAAGATGTLKTFNNILYFDNGTINIPVSTLVPSGGTTGQVLAKSSATDYAVSWITPSSGVTGAGTSTANGLIIFSDTTGAALATTMISATATGALQTFGVGTGSVVGSARGTGAVDLQVNRAVASQVASGNYSFVVGASNTASALYSTIIGFAGVASKYGQFTQAAGQFANAGDAQTGSYVLRTATTDATVTEVTLDGGAATVANKIVIGIGQSLAFTGTLIGQTASAALSSSWTIQGHISRGATGIPILVGTPAITRIGVTAGATAWTNNIAVDGTNNALQVTVTGAAATSIRWVLNLRTVEVIF